MLGSRISSHSKSIHHTRKAPTPLAAAAKAPSRGVAGAMPTPAGGSFAAPAPLSSHNPPGGVVAGIPAAAFVRAGSGLGAGSAVSSPAGAFHLLTPAEVPHADLVPPTSSVDSISPAKAGQPATEITINGRKHQVLAVLGSGAFGKVFKVKDELGQEFAMKIIDKRNPKVGGDTSKLLNEYNIQSQLHHENIASLYGCAENGDFFIMKMELLEGEELFDFIAGKGNPGDPDYRPPHPLTSVELQQLITQLKSALQECHRHSIYHLDIKPENIIFNPRTGKFKLFDFGLSIQLPNPENPAGIRMAGLNEHFGTFEYLDPAIIGSDKGITELNIAQSESFSLGVTLTIAKLARDSHDYLDKFKTILNNKLHHRPLSTEETTFLKYCLELFRSYGMKYSSHYEDKFYVSCFIPRLASRHLPAVTPEDIEAKRFILQLLEPDHTRRLII